jgi:hypothetical protein
MLKYTLEAGLIPNLTVAELTNEKAELLAKYCGAVAVSCYNDKNVCYDTIEKLINNGLKQVNMHFMISKETYEKALEVVKDIKKDKRLEKLNAIVFLSLKKKGRGEKHNCLSLEEFENLFRLVQKNNITFGFDSCSANKVFEITKNDKGFEEIKKNIEPCEATSFSSYFDINGFFYPCSFLEGIKGWEQGISIESVKDFKEIWYNEKVVKFRNHLLENLDSNGCRQCSNFNI